MPNLIDGLLLMANTRDHLHAVNDRASDRTSPVTSHNPVQRGPHKTLMFDRRNRKFIADMAEDQALRADRRYDGRETEAAPGGGFSPD